eukprot:COSAG05_NODE_20734_length_277_cov_0.584270_1_plen_55_part_01
MGQTPESSKFRVLAYVINLHTQINRDYDIIMTPLYEGVGLGRKCGTWNAQPASLS